MHKTDTLHDGHAYLPVCLFNLRNYSMDFEEILYRMPTVKITG